MCEMNYSNNKFSKQLLLSFGILALFFLMPSAATAQTVRGKVFRDFNSNGVLDSNSLAKESGISGVTITAYNRTGTSLGATVSDTWGVYTLTVGTTDSIRIEFSGWSSFDKPSAVGSSNGGVVQFVVGGATNVNFGLNNPIHYTQSNPLLVTSCYINGRTDTTGINDVLVRWLYNNTNTQTNGKRVIATKQQIGSTWGLAYARETKKMYVASFLKRHSGLPDLNSDGFGDLGNIYEVPFSDTTTTPSVSVWLRIDTIAGINIGTVPNDRTRGLGIPTATNRDSGVLRDILKKGIGGIELSEDEQTLYVVNLYEKKVHLINMTTKSLIGTLDIPDPACTNGTYRPFGVKYYKGKLYVGVICDASVSGNNADMTAYVYAHDGTSFAQVLSFPLNYTRQDVFVGCGFSTWQSWRDAYPGRLTCLTSTADLQPSLCDIEFDPSNDGMIISLMDRFGHMGGYRNLDDSASTLHNALVGGDILYAYKSGANQWTIESGGDRDGTGPYAARPDQISPPNALGGASEFYREEINSLGGFPTGHREIVAGGISVYPPQNQVDVIVIDPLTSFSGGTKRMFNTNGLWGNGYEIFVSPTNPSGVSTFGKAAGLGDLEVVALPAPIEIGNRVWADANGNGIQDANERPLANVTVELRDSATNTLIATAKTNSRGNYYFSSAIGTNPVDSSAKYNLNLAKNTTYIVAISNITGRNQQAAFRGLSPSTSNAGSNDEIDSDAAVASNVNKVFVNITAAGENIHNLDFGFAPCVTPTLTSVQTDTATCAGDGSSNTDARIILRGIANASRYQVSVGNGDDLAYSTATPFTADSLYIENLSAGTYLVRLFGADSLCAMDTSIVIASSRCPFPITDIALTKTINTTSASLGDTVVYTLVVTNEGAFRASNVTVLDSMPAGLTFVSATPSAFRPSVYDAASGIWQIGVLNAGETVMIEISARLDSVGTLYNTAEVHTMDNEDSDSTPDNDIQTEDDYAQACVSVPMPICVGDTLQLTLPVSLINIQWYLNGNPIAGATNPVLAVSRVGNYTFTADNLVCPAGGCCPIIVVKGTNCTIPCKPVICLPVTTVRQ